jgi:undecaprenyl-diphosphatase
MAVVRRTALEPERHVLHLPYLWRAALAAAVLVVSAVIAKQGVPRWEESIFRAIYQLPDWLSAVLWLPMQLGTLWAPFIVGGCAWLAWRRWRPAVGAVVMGLVAWWAAKLVKNAVGRGRPANVLTDFTLRTGAPREGLGFLSGHCAVAFCLATVLSPYLTPRKRIVAFALAVVVAVARIETGAHLPLDTVGGAAMGCLLGWIWHMIVGVPESVAHHGWVTPGRRPRVGASEGSI